MNLSVEVKVAVAVAMAFAFLTLGVVAQEGSQHQNAGLSQSSEISSSVQNVSSESPLLTGTDKGRGRAEAP